MRTEEEPGGEAGSLGSKYHRVLKDRFIAVEDRVALACALLHESEVQLLVKYPKICGSIIET